MAWTISRAMGMSVLYENFLLHDWLSRTRVTYRNSSDPLYRERFVVHWRFALANACHPGNGVSLRSGHLLVVKGEFPWHERFTRASLRRGDSTWHGFLPVATRLH